MKSKENDTLISIGLIVIYVFLNSFCINKFSVLSYKTTIINFIRKKEGITKLLWVC